MMFKKCSIFNELILRAFNFIKTVYELFDNPSYIIFEGISISKVQFCKSSYHFYEKF